MSRSRSRSPIRRGGSSGMDGRRDRAGFGDRRGGSRIDHKSDRMVYLSNLPWELKWMELKDIIREKAGEVNFVEVLEERDGRSKGCAVVEFKNREGATKCIENMHRTELRDRLIIAKEIRDPIAFFRKVKEDTGIDFLGGGDRPERSRGSGNFDNNTGAGPTINENETFGLSPTFLRQLGISTPLCNRVFLTNIPYNMGVGRIFDVCSLAGKVTWFDLQMDKEGKSKGMAVCEYSHPIEAVQAVSMLNNQRLLDRTLAVRMDRYPKESERHREPGGLPFGLRAVGMGLGANGAPLTDVASVISTIAPTAPPPSIGLGMNGGTAPTPAPFVPAPTPPVVPTVNLNSWATGPINSSPMVQPQVQQTPSSQTSFLSHATGGFFNAPTQPRSTSSTGIQQQFGAMSQQQFQPKPPVQSQSGGYVPQQQQQQAAMPPQAQVKYEMGSYGNFVPSSNNSSAGNLSIPSHGSGAGAFEVSRVILIKNLPMDYTWQIVSDRIGQYGDLENVEMISPGVAKVRFVQLKDAERVKNALQGTTVEGRAIGIEYL